MDSREHPRIQLPFEVEVHHPSMGRARCIARDISEGGMFVTLAGSGIRPGSKVKVTVLASTLVEGTPTPTVTMDVVRAAEEGLGLSFSNRTSRHLWDSVVRQREELAIGRDYFQVFQAAVVVSPQSKVLVVQEHGRWLFPGTYLVVGQPWLDGLRRYLSSELGAKDLDFRETVDVDSGTDVIARERATLTLFHRFHCATAQAAPRSGGRYSRVRWIGRATTGLDELSFSHARLREIARRALDHADAEREAPSQERRLPGT